MRNLVKPAFVRSPTGLLVILVALLFVAEVIAMLLLSALPALPPMMTNFLDAIILVVLVFPALRVFAFAPLLRQLRAREAAEERLREANRTLEQRVRERTAALEESEQSIRLLLDSIAEGFYSVDLQGNCTRINRSALRMLGYDTEEELLGRHIHELIHHTRPDGTPYPAGECRMYQALRYRTKCHVDDEVFWRPDGTSFPVEYRSHPIFRDGQLIGAVASFFDITERQRLQQERERMITELQQTLADVKQLGGLLPICAGCKQIRDDAGYWNQVEVYITERSAAKFTHGLCPICTRKFFPDLTPDDLYPNP